MRRSVFLFALLLILSMLVELNAGDLIGPKPPHSIEQLRAWHKSMEGDWPWLGQPEQKVHLRTQKDYELLLATHGYARGGTFVLFVNINGAWTQISDPIEQAHHPLHILQTGREGWHDFESFVPAWGSGGTEVWVFTYGWDGKKYLLRNRKDGKWCGIDSFKGDVRLCPSR
ncbi:MAG: hypothetical protein A4E63_03570 [Syntrophorhabdus sp. PtaU1.Bin050]|nr:MAG: hypothetical protein A4E63_03570 [Syntrophorhabdus sp. PtaU1.Bin050]